MRALPFFAASALAVAVALASGDAHAEGSDHGGFYVQGSPLGTGIVFYPGTTVSVGNITFSTGGALAYYRVDADFGYHFSGHSEGLVLALRQAFLIGWGSAGITSARVGYDIPIKIGDEMELTIAPYAHLGALYAFGSGGGAAFHFGIGVDGKLFFNRDLGLYAFMRPLEFAMNVNDGPVFTQLSFAGGLGYAF